MIELSQNINTLAFCFLQTEAVKKAVKKERKGVGSGKKEKKTEEPD